MLDENSISYYKSDLVRNSLCFCLAMMSLAAERRRIFKTPNSVHARVCVCARARLVSCIPSHVIHMWPD